MTNMSNVHSCTICGSSDQYHCTFHRRPTSPALLRCGLSHQYQCTVVVGGVGVHGYAGMPLHRDIVLFKPVPALVSGVAYLDIDLTRQFAFP
jgi:hypothetical protein